MTARTTPVGRTRRRTLAPPPPAGSAPRSRAGPRGDRRARAGRAARSAAAGGPGEEARARALAAERIVTALLVRLVRRGTLPGADAAGGLAGAGAAPRRRAEP